MNVIKARGETMKIKREAVRQMLPRDTTARINENMRVFYGGGFLTLKAHYSQEV